MASRREADRPEPSRLPPIPASCVEPTAEDEGLLLWVRHGTMTVDFDDRPALEVVGGQAAWIPPGTNHSVDLRAGSVAVPLLVEHAPASEWPEVAAVVTVPDSWSTWILHRLSRWFGFASGFDADPHRPAELFAGVDTSAGAGRLPPLPPRPRSPGARRVVERLLRDPACPADLDELAATAHLSSRTLQRRLTIETGASLAEWRTAARIHAAAGYLSRGRGLEWTAHRVGYATLSSFSHAFRNRVGLSPGRFAASHASDPVDEQDPGLSAPPLVEARPPAVPPAPASPWISSFDGVLWVMRGSARVAVAGQQRELVRGDVVWLARGVSHVIEIDADSVVLPLGMKASGPPVRAGSLRVVQVATDDETERFLLHTVVANHFLLRPPDHDDQAFLDLVHPQAPLPPALPSHIARLVASVVDDPADRRSLTQWAADLDVDPIRLRRDFVRCLGEPFPQWRAAARMTVARGLLWDGLSPTLVARRLGYTHLSAFSKAFTNAYGIPPREWLRREAA